MINQTINYVGLRGVYFLIFLVAPSLWIIAGQNFPDDIQVKQKLLNEILDGTNRLHCVGLSSQSICSLL